MPDTAVLNTIQPERAPVVPRGSPIGGGETLPLETHVRALIRRNPVIAILGPGGSGKTTALAHLAAALSDLGLDYHDEPADLTSIRIAGHPSVIALAEPPPSGHVDVVLRLAPWSESERIDYLLARHPTQTRSVMDRLKACDVVDELDGSPRLWTLVLDHLACHPDARDVHAILRFTVHSMIRADESAMRQSMAAAAVGGAVALAIPPLLRHPAMLRIACVDEFLLGLHREHTALAGWEAVRERGLVRLIANRLHERPHTLEQLKDRVQTPLADPSYIRGLAGAASVLFAVDPAYRPAPMLRHLSHLAAAGARWAGIQLAGTHLNHADLRGADLSRASLQELWAIGTDFRGANLSGSRLDSGTLLEANFEDASLANACLRNADLTGVIATAADLNHADLRSTKLTGADLRGASLRRADCADCDFTNAQFDAADLTEARIDGAVFIDVDFRNAILDGMRGPGATFARARLEGMTIDGLDLQQANFVSADLTGSTFRRATLFGANFRQAGLADVDWEGADLRQCDFMNAAFHMGSSRSGLVYSPTTGFSPIACEGSRTGFYSDDYAERDYRPPEAIRKANLCGANLIGARVVGTDWYLVDLRGALYTTQQADWFRRCGAILGDRA